MREISIKNNEIYLKDNQIIEILDRKIKPFGNSAKADVPKRHIGKRSYVIILDD
jgi:putative transposon-encoded protein